MTKLRKIITAGLLLATMIVLDRFVAINTPIVSIGFAFIPTILSAMLLGPVWTPILAVLCDILGCLIKPFGAYFWGYTLTALISGVLYGIILNKTYKKSVKQFLWRIILACVLVSLICNCTLNTLWVIMTTKKAFTVLLPTRLIKEAILLPMRIVIMLGIHAAFIKLGVYKNLFKDELSDNQENDGELSGENSNEQVESNKNEKAEKIDSDKRTEDIGNDKNAEKTDNVGDAKKTKQVDIEKDSKKSEQTETVNEKKRGKVAASKTSNRASKKTDAKSKEVEVNSKQKKKNSAGEK